MDNNLKHKNPKQIKQNLIEKIYENCLKKNSNRQKKKA